MNVGESVRKSIDDWEQDELESAMLHACNAIDGTARKVYPSIPGSNSRFTQLLRDNYAILGPMGAPGIDLEMTRFPVEVKRPKAQGGQPDLADVIYGIHRCVEGHGAELPAGFELLPDSKGPPRLTNMAVRRGKVRLSDRIIFGLLAVAVLSPANDDQRVPDDYYLTFGTDVVLPINEWWGRAGDFGAIVAKDPVPSVRLDFGEWMGDG